MWVVVHFFCFLLQTSRSLSEIERWLSELSKELVLRLEEVRQSDGQVPSKLTVSFGEIQKVHTYLHTYMHAFNGADGWRYWDCM